MIIGQSGVCYSTIYEFSQLRPGENAFVVEIKRLAPGLFILSMLNNFMITGMIIFKIMQAQRRVRLLHDKEGASAYRTVIANTIESGILYPGLLLVTVILYEENSNGQDIVRIDWLLPPTYADDSSV